MDHFKGQPRLPKFAVPKRYDIRLKPDLVACTFAGNVAVDLDIVSDTNFIVLNAADLTVAPDAVSFTNSSSSKVLSRFCDFVSALLFSSSDFFVNRGFFCLKLWKSCELYLVRGILIFLLFVCFRENLSSDSQIFIIFM